MIQLNNRLEKIIKIICLNLISIFVITISFGFATLSTIIFYIKMRQQNVKVINYATELMKILRTTILKSIAYNIIIIALSINFSITTNSYLRILIIFMLIQFLLSSIYIAYVLILTKLNFFKQLSFSFLISNINFGLSIIMLVVMLGLLYIIVLSPILILVVFEIYYMITNKYCNLIIKKYLIKEKND